MSNVLTEKLFCGLAVSSGYAIGTAYWLKKDAEIEDKEAGSPSEEWSRCIEAIQQSKEQIQSLQTSGVSSEIMEAHIAILDDPELSNEVKQEVFQSRQSAESAFRNVFGKHIESLALVENDYLKERATDLEDLLRRVVRNLDQGVVLPQFTEDTILFVEELHPSMALENLDNRIVGYATLRGGKTSHSAIIVKGLRIPAVFGLGDGITAIPDGSFVILDGVDGVLYVNPEEALLDSYRQKLADFNEKWSRLQNIAMEPSVTKDGTAIEIAANLAYIEELQVVSSYRPDGIGLFRTEFLYIDKLDFPTEEVQYQAYTKVLKALSPKPVIIRTMDIGGDKPLLYFPIHEKNPFLGYRGLRISLDREDLLRTQLRALYRASSCGNVKIMFPMVSTIEEFLKAKTVAEEIRAEVGAQRVPLGIMIETPASAVMVDAFIDDVDFISIGTNDLTQYVMAVDRGNAKVSNLYDPRNPAVLRLIAHVIKVAREHGKWVGMCGELAGDLELTPFLLGLGINELSVSPAKVLEVKERVSKLSPVECTPIVDAFLAAKSVLEVEKALQPKGSPVLADVQFDDSLCRYELILHSKLGLHARPASEVCALAAKAKHDVFIIREAVRLNAKSVIHLLSGSIKSGDSIVIETNVEDVGVLEEIAQYLLNLDE